jgi:hypothetical protein
MQRTGLLLAGLRLTGQSPQRQAGRSGCNGLIFCLAMFLLAIGTAICLPIRLIFWRAKALDRRFERISRCRGSYTRQQ